MQALDAQPELGCESDLLRDAVAQCSCRTSDRFREIANAAGTMDGEGLEGTVSPQFIPQESCHSSGRLVPGCQLTQLLQ